MKIRILAASALTLVTLSGAAFAEPSNGNWDKCPGGFDPATNLCLTRDRFDHAFPHTMKRSYDKPAYAAPLSPQGGQMLHP